MQGQAQLSLAVQRKLDELYARGVNPNDIDDRARGFAHIAPWTARRARRYCLRNLSGSRAVPCRARFLASMREEDCFSALDEYVQAVTALSSNIRNKSAYLMGVLRKCATRTAAPSSKLPAYLPPWPFSQVSNAGFRGRWRRWPNRRRCRCISSRARPDVDDGGRKWGAAGSHCRGGEARRAVQRRDPTV